MAITLLQTSTVEVNTASLVASATLAVHPDADYVVFFVGVSTADDATERGITGILHRYGGDTVSVMKEASTLDANNRRFHFQMGRLQNPPTGDNTYEVRFGYTGSKNLLIVALSYQGIHPSPPAMYGEVSETVSDAPLASVYTTATGTFSGDRVVDGVLYREIMPGGAPTASGGDPLRSVATASGIFTVENEDWGIICTEKLTLGSGIYELGYSGFANPHIHIAGVLVAS